MTSHPHGLDFHISKVPALDGVRGIAILLVFAVHTSPVLLRGGRIGVDLFFVLSGFLITSILLQEHRRRDAIHLGYFYMRRALRLFPALASVIAFALLYVALFKPDELALALDNALWVAGYVYNWRIITSQPTWLDHHWMFSHVWSLSVEEQFYIVWPLVLIGLLRARQRVRFAVVIALIIAPTIARAALWLYEPSIHWYFNTFVRFDGLMWGALAAMMVDAGYIPRGRGKQHTSWLGPLAFAALIGIATMEGMNGELYLFGFALVGLCSAVLIYCSAVCPLAWFTPMLEWKPLRWTGMISYGLYLWHIPMARIIEELALQPILGTVLLFGSTFTIATLSFYFYERRFLRMKDRFSAQRTRPALA